MRRRVGIATMALTQQDVGCSQGGFSGPGFDGVIHAGDYAYDFSVDGGSVGDRFMNALQPFASKVSHDFVLMWLFLWLWRRAISYFLDTHCGLGAHAFTAVRAGAVHGGGGEPRVRREQPAALRPTLRWALTRRQHLGRKWSWVDPQGRRPLVLVGRRPHPLHRRQL